jgi:transposase
LEGHVVLSAEHAGDTRAALVEPVGCEGACPDCGVLSSRVQARPIHRVRDVQCGGAPLEVRVRKRRLACLEPECPRRSFVQTTDEIRLRSRLTSMLVAGIVAGLSTELRAVSGVAAAAGRVMDNSHARHR